MKKRAPPLHTQGGRSRMPPRRPTRGSLAAGSSSTKHMEREQRKDYWRMGTKDPRIINRLRIRWMGLVAIGASARKLGKKYEQQLARR